MFISVVDDEIDLARLFKDALSQIPNVQVFAFSDPVLALEHFEHNQKNYVCVISDYRMPVLNGIELLSKVKQIKGGVISILISAFEIGDKVFENCGCVDKFLQKPITIRALLAEVQTCIDFIGVRKTAN